MYETFEHTADLGLLVEAADLNSLFAEAGRGLLSILVEDVDAVLPRHEVTIEVSGTERDYLLFDWLSELLYRYETEQLLFSQFDVTTGPNGLTAIARGESLDAERHEPTHEVKAITYHDFVVEPTANGWQAKLIVDI
ncbi:MAG: archease [Planctomycetaceae bacterium]|jgi:SHS2 domain-containing protein|nr:archease [Planctomycetaceae bacterium]MBT6154568.1 archease [Planctomycetaceae bacterium]MBT6486598.1 archease [Planctomycetaceae bacterium]MBT6494472.1 archease [Planctomycetaceae bacterium]